MISPTYYHCTPYFYCVYLLWLHIPIVMAPTYLPTYLLLLHLPIVIARTYLPIVIAPTYIHTHFYCTYHDCTTYYYCDYIKIFANWYGVVRMQYFRYSQIIWLAFWCVPVLVSWLYEMSNEMKVTIVWKFKDDVSETLRWCNKYYDGAMVRLVSVLDLYTF